MAQNHLRRGEIKRDHAWQPHSSLLVSSEQEKKGKQRHHARRYGEKLISRPESLKRHKERRGRGPRGHGLVGEGAAQISSLSFSSTLTFCIKVVTSGREFLGFCVMSLRLRRREREGGQ